MKTSSIACWNKLKSLRTNSLCTTCSAWNYKYYKYQLFGLSLNDCKAFISTCDPFFSAYTYLQQFARIVFSDFLKVLNPATTYSATYSTLDSYYFISEMSHLHNWQNYQLQTLRDLAGAEKTQIELCQKMLSIHKDPILYKMTKFFNSAVEAYISEYSRLTGRKLSLKERSSRSLQTATLVTVPPPEFTNQEVHVLRSSNTDLANNMITPDGSSFTVQPANIY